MQKSNMLTTPTANPARQGGINHAGHLIRYALLSALLFLVGLLAASNVSAITFTYTNTTVDNWNDTANWLGGVVPTNGVRIDLRGNTTVTFPGGSIALGEGDRPFLISSSSGGLSTFNITNGTVTADPASSSPGAIGNNANAGALIVSGGLLDLTTSGGNGADLSVTRGSSASASGLLTITNGGEVRVRGLLFGDGNASSGGTGTVNLDSGGILTVNQVYEGSQGGVVSDRPVTSTVNLNGGTLKAWGSDGFIANNLSALNLNANTTIEVASNDFTIGTALIAGGSFGVTKTGAGSVTLGGANSYSGPTIVSAGKLLTSVSSSGSTYTTDTGTTLGFVGNAATLSAGAITNGSTTTNIFQIGTGNPTASPLVSVSGNLVMNGNVIINVSQTAYTAGTYVLIDYSSATRSGVGSYVGGSLPLFASIVDDTGAKQVKLVYSADGKSALNWNVTDGVWDFAAANWFNTVTFAAGEVFANGDFVTFSSPQGTVNVSAAVNPGSMTISNDVGDFIFTGSGAIGGTNGFVKSGLYPAWLLSSNSFTGVVTVNSGNVDQSMLVVSNGAALGAGGAGNGTVVTSGGTLALVGNITVPNEELSLEGGGFTADGSTEARLRGALQSKSGSNTWGGNIVLNGSGGRIGTQDGASLSVNGTVAALASGLTIRPGANSVVRLNAQNSWVGGVLLFGSSPVGLSTILLGTSDALDVNQNIQVGNVSLDLNGFSQTVGSVILASGGSVVASNSIILNNAVGTTSILTVSNSSDNGFGGDVKDGAGKLAVVKTGSARQNLNGTNTYSGTTTVLDGNLRINGDSSAVTNNWTISGGVLSGRGIIGGAVSVGTSASLRPGSGDIDTLTINSNLTLAGSTVMEVTLDGVGTNDLVVVTGSANYGGSMVVTNVGGTALTNGSVFNVFSVTGSKTGSISSVTVVPDAGLTGTFDPATGNVTISTAVVSPATLNFTNVSAGVYQFSWTGSFKLQYQTNAASKGLSTNWADYPDISNPVNVTNNPVIPTTFFRLISTP